MKMASAITSAIDHFDDSSPRNLATRFSRSKAGLYRQKAKVKIFKIGKDDAERQHQYADNPHIRPALRDQRLEHFEHALTLKVEHLVGERDRLAQERDAQT